MTGHISATGLSKQFRLYQRPFDRAVDWLTPGPPRRGEAIWALRNVTLTARSGRVLGVVGRNGAGKSTLLRLLSGSLIPNEGECARRGRVLSLHGFSLGLSGALTGRENVEVAADLVRLPPGYVDVHMERIAEFSGLGEFFDRPVAVYSSGMRTRLACASFAFLEPDILLLDEALSAGDAFFTRRWRDRLEELMATGAGVVMAGHDLETIKDLCHETLWLDRGVVAFQGESTEAVDRYLKSSAVTP
jgi:lipopolysaccharide transport system ATP-binding protein